MHKRLFGLIVFFIMTLVASMAYPSAAAENDTQATIFVLLDSGVNDSHDARLAKSQTALANWMKNDLIKVFARYAKAGFQAKLIEKRSDFIPRPNNYLLNVKITDYRPGSRAARIVVGFGAGGLSIKIHYELFAEGLNTLITKDDSVYSGREWMYAARKLNQNTAKAVIEKLKDK